MTDEPGVDGRADRRGEGRGQMPAADDKAKAADVRDISLHRRILEDVEGKILSGAWLIAKVPWSAAEHRIRAIGADPRVAERLKIAPGTACLVVERRTWSGGTYITHVRLTYPGESHELVAEFSPSHPRE